LSSSGSERDANPLLLPEGLCCVGENRTRPPGNTGMLPEAEIIRIARDLLYNRAMVYYQDKPIGTLAAIPQKTYAYVEGQLKVVGSRSDLNYHEVFIRDNVPVMVFFLLDGRADIMRRFLDTCLSLQSTRPQTAGTFPSSFTVDGDRLLGDYGQRAIGRVISVDATLWWPILAHLYVQRSQDEDWARQPQVQKGLQRFLDLILHPGFRDAPTLHVPDGAFMIDRPMDVWGCPLEIQVLLYGALLSTAALIRLDLQNKEGCDSDPFAQKQRWQTQQVVNWARRLRRYLLKNYWVNTHTVQVLRRRPTEQYGDAISNEYNIQTETIPHWLQHWLGSRGGYLIGNVRTGRPDFRFFSLGNCLGAIFDVLSQAQQRALFSLILQNRGELIAEMPLRICHPPLDDADWRNKTGYDPKNRAWCYHNAGHWPCLLWFLILAVLRHQRGSSPDSGLRNGWLYLPMQDLLQESYQILLRRLPEQKWAEYFDGPTGVWMGQQARLYQTWTVAGLLLAHHLLKVNPEDANVFDLPQLGSLPRARR
jgi:hypothetical protein